MKTINQLVDKMLYSEPHWYNSQGFVLRQLSMLFALPSSLGWSKSSFSACHTSWGPLFGNHKKAFSLCLQYNVFHKDTTSREDIVSELWFPAFHVFFLLFFFRACLIWRCCWDSFLTLLPCPVKWQTAAVDPQTTNDIGDRKDLLWLTHWPEQTKHC